MQIQNPQLKRFAFLVSQPRIVRAGLWMLTAIFAIYAVWVLAQLTWQLLAPGSAPSSGPIAVQMQQQTNTTSGSLRRLADLELFGATLSSAGSVRNAPKTTLNVRLLGVSASSVPERSAAVIERNRNQDTYVIGDKITDTQVSIEKIYADRVILNNNGALETLELEGIGELSQGVRLTLSNQLPERGTEEEALMSDDELKAVSDAQRAYRELRQGDHTALLDYIRIRPEMSGQTLKGYRLSPGKYPEVFTNAGFQPGDIAVAINGQSLTDIASAQVAIGELRNAQQIIVTVLREDEYLDLELAVPSE
ncbi:type II secretion system protein GspC [Pseudidiomarina sp. E22-M8]|uniref:type II secretion system protein GspC n=1 Tax=Pseudidiomarina sp. E22-M8 TaxID=3424768 RepID=UPI00403C7C77